MKLKLMVYFSIYQFSIVCDIDSFAKCIALYCFMASSAKKKYMTSKNWAHSGGRVLMNFHVTQK